MQSPCSCGHFEMRLTYVVLSVTKLWAIEEKKIFYPTKSQPEGYCNSGGGGSSENFIRYIVLQRRVLRGQRGWVSSLLCHGPEPQPTKWQCREVKISTILNLNKFSSGWSSWWRTGSERFTRKIDCKMFSWVLRRWGRGALAWSPLTSTVKSWELLSGESWRWGDVVWDMVGEWRSCAERP